MRTALPPQQLNAVDKVSPAGMTVENGQAAQFGLLLFFKCNIHVTFLFDNSHFVGGPQICRAKWISLGAKSIFIAFPPTGDKAEAVRASVHCTAPLDRWRRLQYP